MKPYFQDEAVTLYHGDCREVLPTLADGSIDLVLTDPPYGTGGWRRTEKGQGRNPSGKIVVEDWDDGEVDWLLMLPDVAVFTFWPAGRISKLLDAAIDRGLTKHRAFYMRKTDPKPMPGGRTRWSVEPIWVLSREGFVSLGGDDCCEASTPRKGRDSGATGHPYEKPIAVIKWLVGKTTASTILDPFCGSGTTLRAAKDMGRKAIGIETEEAYCEMTARRMEQGVLEFTED